VATAVETVVALEDLVEASLASRWEDLVVLLAAIHKGAVDLLVEEVAVEAT